MSSRFAYQCDKLEADLQARLYDEEKSVDIFSSVNKDLINTEWNQKAVLNGAKKLSDLFIAYDYNNYDEIFKKIIDDINK